MFVQMALWWLLWLALGLIAWAPVALAARQAPARGYPLAKTVGWIAAGLFAWLWASAGFGRPGVVTAWIGVGLLAAVGVASAVSVARAESGFLRRHGLRALKWEAAFLALFLIFCSLQAVLLPEPDGERMLDLQILNIVDRAEKLPPADTWWAGGDLNYYYIGHFLAVFAGQLTATPVNEVYGLALASLGALFALQILCLLRMTNYGRTATALTFVVVVFGGGFAIVRNWVSFGVLFPPDFWFSAGRVIPRISTEFPFLSFTVGELHAHVLALPAWALAINLVAVGFLRQRPSTYDTGSNIGVIARIAISALALAMLWMTDPAVGVAASGLFLAAPLFRAAISIDNASGIQWGRLIRDLAEIVGALALAALISLPLYHNFAAGSAHPAFVGTSNTILHHWLTYFGLAALSVPLFLLWIGLSPPQKSASIERRPKRIAILIGSWAVLQALTATLTPPTLAPALSCVLLAIFAVLAWRTAPRTGVWESADQILYFFALWGLAIVFGCEIVMVEGGYSTEMHRVYTVFRFYLPAWILLSLALAPVLDRLFSAPASHASQSPRIGLPLLRAFVLAATAVTLVYPIAEIARNARAHIGQMTLGATSGLLRHAPDDLDAVHWLRANAPPGSVVLEAPGARIEGNQLIQLGGPSYAGFCRISAATGLPTLVGSHEKLQQQGHTQEEIERRWTAAIDLYLSPDLDRVAQGLADWDIRYVVVGAKEREIFPERALSRWAELGRETFVSGETAVYEIEPWRTKLKNMRH